MTIHLQSVTFQELSKLKPFTQVDAQVTHIPHLREVHLEVRVHVHVKLLSVLDGLPNTPLTSHLRRAIDDQVPYLYIT